MIFAMKTGNNLDFFGHILSVRKKIRAISYVPRRDLRSADNLLFCQPSYSTKSYGSRAFSVSAPCIWNKLPMDFKCNPSIAIFKRKLKTHLFKLAYYYFFMLFIFLYLGVN